MWFQYPIISHFWRIHEEARILWPFWVPHQRPFPKMGVLNIQGTYWPGQNLHSPMSNDEIGEQRTYIVSKFFPQISWLVRDTLWWYSFIIQKMPKHGVKVSQNSPSNSIQMYPDRHNLKNQKYKNHLKHKNVPCKKMSMLVPKDWFCMEYWW